VGEQAKMPKKELRLPRQQNSENILAVVRIGWMRSQIRDKEGSKDAHSN